MGRSDLATVEGWSSGKNTRKKWAVAQIDNYREAIKQYHVLAKEKHEGIYLKALSYSKPQPVMTAGRSMHLFLKES